MTPVPSSSNLWPLKMTYRGRINRRIDAMSTMLRSLFAAALCSASEEQLEGGIIPDGANDAEYVARGTRYSGPITATGGGVVAIQLNYADPKSPTGRSAYWCTGTIYNERTVLTAAHCLIGLPDLRPKVFTGPNFRTNTGTIHKVDQYVVNPDFVADSSRAFTFDLGILRLSDPIQGTLPATLSTNRPAAGGNVILVGYGLNGTLSTGYTARQDGYARGGTSLVEGVTASNEDHRFYVDTLFLPTTPGSILVAPGDSGGGAFEVDETGQKTAQTGLIVATAGLGITLLDLTAPEVQTFIRKNAAPPNLSIQRYGDGVLVAWPYSPGFHLQTAPTPQGPWADATNSTSVANLQAKVIFNSNINSPVQLFRLRNEGP